MTELLQPTLAHYYANMEVLDVDRQLYHIYFGRYKMCYRFAKDIEEAMHYELTHFGKDDYRRFKNALIVVPLDPNYQQARPRVTVARIKSVFRSEKPAAAMSTRSQFSLGENWQDPAKTKTVIDYLQHDYSESSQEKIKETIQYFINKYGYSNRLDK